MYKLSTAQWRLATVLLSTFCCWPCAGPSRAPACSAAPDWRHIGNFTVELGLAGPASGPVQASLVRDGRNAVCRRPHRAVCIRRPIWRTGSETAAAVPPAVVNANGREVFPKPGAQTRALAGDNSRVYAFGKFVYRSEDGGAHWENADRLYAGLSIAGGRRGAIWRSRRATAMRS